MERARGRGGILSALMLGMLLGAGATVVQWRLACRVPESEACVWGRAYLPVSLVLGSIAGMVLAAIGFTVLRAVQRGGTPRDPGT